MSDTVVTDPKVEAIFRKMWQKDSTRFGQIEKKLRELAENPEIGLHIGHYILMYRIDRKNQKILLVDYSHHDEAY